MTWKTLLSEYVHQRNQMELNCSVEPIQPLVSDTSFLNRQTLLLARRADTQQERAFSPLKCETRLILDVIYEHTDRAVADITLKRHACGRIGSADELEEYRIERERITLQQEDGEWTIGKIVSLDAEHAFRSVPVVSGIGQEVLTDMHVSGTVRSHSIPFLNRKLLRDPQDGSSARVQYNRTAAATYADLWWDRGNPAYLSFDVDCTNYVSQCLFAGGAPMNYTGKRDSGWWYQGRTGSQELWSFSWAVAHSLPMYLLGSRSGLRGEEVAEPGQLDIGDVISYDWDGSGRYQHSTIVTAKDANGMPLVNAHTVSSKHRYWSYTDSPAWTDRTRYRFVHIVDTF
ncbi:amidase domain-containing protein [Paenibacillus sp. YYML68]|uniref:amidase domain-containing protein n=1 Tax=Paenibacillus sp. YYML68 TaxID=2909250 RepID=UPI002492B958|nr:amidase domain-containing protein [Paenibacillus sp. YYML68]